MKTIGELEQQVGYELEGQISESLLEEYQKAVSHLIALIDELIGSPISFPITWEDAIAVAEHQLEVCEVVKQMLI